MTNITALEAANAKRWANIKLTRNFAGIVKSLVASKARYQAVEARTGVPWFVIAAIHERESSQNWGRSLAQGDPINRVSVHVPAGRGPFISWEAAAIDALVNCAPYLARKKWRNAGEVLTNLELYNGAGYATRGVPSPYVFAGTNQYTAGKYVADGNYDPSHVDTQPGCANLIAAMMAIDPTITLTGAKITPQSDTAKPKTVGKKSAGAVVAGGAAATVAHQSGLGIGWIIGIAAAVALAAFPRMEVQEMILFGSICFVAGGAAVWFFKDKMTSFYKSSEDQIGALEDKIRALKAKP
jgi:lysozyme family protein